MALAAAARARDTTSLEPLVCFIFYFYSITLKFILGPLNVSKRAPRIEGKGRRRDEGRGLETDLISSPGAFFFFHFFCVLLIIIIIRLCVRMMTMQVRVWEPQWPQ